jgi:hypothetical protein
MSDELHPSLKYPKLLAGPLPCGLSADGLGPPGEPISVTACVEKIHIRAETISPLLRELLEFRPPPRWGLNE